MPVRFGDARVFKEETTTTTTANVEYSYSTIVLKAISTRLSTTTRKQTLGTIFQLKNLQTTSFQSANVIDLDYKPCCDGLVEVVTENASLTNISDQSHPIYFNMYLFGLKIFIFVLLLFIFFIFLEKIRRWWCDTRTFNENETDISAKPELPSTTVPISKRKKDLPHAPSSTVEITERNFAFPSAPLKPLSIEDKSEYASIQTIYNGSKKGKIDQKETSLV